jgi:hypothetical protein
MDSRACTSWTRGGVVGVAPVGEGARWGSCAPPSPPGHRCAAPQLRKKMWVLDVYVVHAAGRRQSARSTHTKKSPGLGLGLGSGVWAVLLCVLALALASRFLLP